MLGTAGIKLDGRAIRHWRRMSDSQLLRKLEKKRFPLLLHFAEAKLQPHEIRKLYGFYYQQAILPPLVSINGRLASEPTFPIKLSALRHRIQPRPMIEVRVKEATRSEITFTLFAAGASILMLVTSIVPRRKPIVWRISLVYWKNSE